MGNFIPEIKMNFIKEVTIDNRGRIRLPIKILDMLKRKGVTKLALDIKLSEDEIFIRALPLNSLTIEIILLIKDIPESIGEVSRIFQKFELRIGSIYGKKSEKTPHSVKLSVILERFQDKELDKNKFIKELLSGEDVIELLSIT